MDDEKSEDEGMKQNDEDDDALPGKQPSNQSIQPVPTDECL
jgi:hypothetical protein